MDLASFCYLAIAVTVTSDGKGGSGIALLLPEGANPLHEVLLLEPG